MFFHTLDRLMENGRHRSFSRKSWPKMLATGALIYLGAKMLHGLMDDHH